MSVFRWSCGETLLLMSRTLYSYVVRVVWSWSWDSARLKFGKVITNCAYNLQHVLLPVLFYIYRSLTNIMCSVFFQRIVASPTPIMSLMLRWIHKWMRSKHSWVCEFLMNSIYFWHLFLTRILFELALFLLYQATKGWFGISHSWL